MTGSLGQFLTAAGFTASTAGAGLGIVLLWRRRPETVTLPAAVLAAVGYVLAVALMVGALVARDFSIEYVAQVGAADVPLLYTVASLWGALEGSLLLWLGLLAITTVVYAFSARRDPLRPLAVAVLLLVLAAFGAILVGAGSPWGRVAPVPFEGPGPQPLLREHPLMAIHPPVLYLGFVLTSVPFALTIAGLLRGRLDVAWSRSVIAWTRIGWTLLTLGLALGAAWSYMVLGWGGYWGWDPVENLALLPWLGATLLLHVAVDGPRRSSGSMAFLAIATFLLTLLATFVTRSGLLASVHAFTASDVGPWFLAIVLAAMVGSLVLLVARSTAAAHLPSAPSERPDGAARVPQAEEGAPAGPVRLDLRRLALRLGVGLIAAVALITLAGTFAPLVSELAGNGSLVLGAAWFEGLVGPLLVLMLLLIGITGTIPWGRLTVKGRSRLLMPLLVMAVASVVMAQRGAGAAATLAAGASVFALASSALGAVRAARSGGGVAPTASRLRGAASAVAGPLAHGGLAVLMLAALASATARSEVIREVGPGDRIRVADEFVEYGGIRSVVRGSEALLIADATVSSSGARLTPAIVTFEQRPEEPVARPAVSMSPTRDLYLTLMAADPVDGRATLRAGYRPLQAWLWVGLAVMVLAGALGALGRRADARARSGGGAPA